jgi:glucose/arabinose dehydrogenase
MGFASGMRLLAGAAAIALIACGCAHAPCELADENVAVTPTISLMPGYSAKRVLDALDRPTQIAIDSENRIFVLEGRAANKRVRIFDAAFREIGGFPIAAEGESTGLLVADGGRTVFVASRGRIERFRADAALTFTAPELLVHDLPEGTGFNNNLRLGPDGLIYFGLGATCDVCDEDDPRSATILRFNPNLEGLANPEIYAQGLRNSYDLIFTERGELLATDNGPDCCPKRGDDCPGPAADRLLLVKQGDHFGWPYIYRKRHDGGGMAIAGALLELGLYAGAAGLVESKGGALCRDAGNLFVALWGQTHNTEEGGRKVMRVKLVRDASGAITGASMERFLGPDGLGHPIALAVSPPGRLYVLDALGFVLEVTANGCS